MGKAIWDGAIAVLAGVIVFAVTSFTDSQGRPRWAWVIGVAVVALLVAGMARRWWVPSEEGTDHKDGTTSGGVSILDHGRTGDLEIDEVDVGEEGPSVSIGRNARVKRRTKITNLRLGRNKE